MATTKNKFYKNVEFYIQNRNQNTNWKLSVSEKIRHSIAQEILQDDSKPTQEFLLEPNNTINYTQNMLRKCTLKYDENAHHFQGWGDEEQNTAYTTNSHCKLPHSKLPLQSPTVISHCKLPQQMSLQSSQQPFATMPQDRQWVNIILWCD
jgi:hypothetical protein